jgi:CheY-like chemotaxis protein
MTHSLNSHAVLVVDDDRDGADSLVMLLQEFGLAARAAYSAADAGRTVQDGFRPDALILDIGLPDLDGYEVAHELCAALPDRPLVVALTGYASLDDRSRCEGFDFHLLKPADPRALLEVLMPPVPPRNSGPQPAAPGVCPGFDAGIGLAKTITPA